MVVGHDAADGRHRCGRPVTIAAHAALSRSAPVAPTSSGSGRGRGPPEEEALSVAHAEVGERLDLPRALDALGDDRGVDLLGERDQACRQRLAGAVGLDAVDQRPVELDELRLEPEDVAQAGEPGARIVDRDARAELAYGLERLAQALIVVDARVLGDLDDDARAVAAGDQTQEPRRGERRRRDVDREVDVRRQRRQRGQRRADGGELQFPQEPDFVGLREPPHRSARRRAAEARQRLGSDGRARRACRSAGRPYATCLRRAPGGCAPRDAGIAPRCAAVRAGARPALRSRCPSPPPRDCPVPGPRARSTSRIVSIELPLTR